MAKAPNLFGPTDFGGGNAAPIDDLFATPKVASPSSSTGGSSYADSVIKTALTPKKPKEPTKKEAAAAERQRIIDHYGNGMAAMLAAPEWQNASYERRQEMYSKWKTSKWSPMVDNLEDRDLASALSDLETSIVKQALDDQRDTLKKGSWLGDTWKGAAINADRMVSYVRDTLPAQNWANLIDSIERAKANGGEPDISFGDMPVAAAGMRAIGKSWDDVYEYAKSELRDDLESQKATERNIEGLRNSQSLARRNNERRAEELREEAVKEHGKGLAGEAIGELNRYLENPGAVFSDALESAPSMIPTVLATAATGGAAAPVAGAFASAALSGQDAGSTALEEINKMPLKELEASPVYKQLIAGGKTPAEARDRIALIAAQEAQVPGAAVGAISALFGPEVALGKVLSGDVAKRALSRKSAAAMAALGYVGHTAAEGAEEAGTQIAANVGIDQSLARKGDMLRGAGQSFVQGVAAGAPLSAASVAPEYRAARAGEPGTTNTQDGSIDGDATIDIPDPAAAAAAEQTAGPDATAAEQPAGNTGDQAAGPEAAGPEATGPEASASEQEAPAASQSADSNPATSALAALRPIFQDINSRAGQTFEATEANAFIDQLIAAEDNGAPRSVIEKALSSISRAVPPGLGYSSILEGYTQRRAARGEAAVDEMANDIVKNEGTTDGPTEPVSDSDSGSASTVSDINSTMEAAADAGEPASATVSETAREPGAEPENAGTGRTESNSAAEDGSATTAAETMGATDGTVAADSRPDNRTVSDSDAAVSPGERSEPGEAGPGTADGRGAESVAAGEARRDPRVGETVTYKVPVFGNHFTGTVTSVNPARGTFSIRTDSGNTYENIPTANITNEPLTDAYGDTTVQAEMSREDNADALAQVQQAVADGRITAEQADRLTKAALREAERTKDRSAAGDYITEKLKRLAGELPVRPQNSSTITPGGRDMPALRGAAYEALGSKDPSVFQAASELTQALVNNDPVAADRAAQTLESAGFSRARPIYQAQEAANHQQEQVGTTSEPGAADAAILREASANTTPSGYDAGNLAEKADRLADRGGEHAFAAMELSEALEKGDFAKADELAQYLYEQGLRQFRPPQESTGRASRTIDDVFLNELDPAERLALQREYEEMRGTLPPEAGSFKAFRDTAVQDQLLMDAGEAPNSNIMTRMSNFGRAIIQKLARGLAIALAAITISNMVPVNDAVAATGRGYVQTVQQVEGLSHAASTVHSWVQQTKDNAGRPYIIADKQSGEIHIVGADGKVKATAPALYGSKIGDGMTLGETPAGIFTIHQEAAPASYGGDLQQFASAPNGDVYAVHRVLTNNKQNRVGRLASKNAKDHRISLGCINIPADLYNKYLSGKFDGKLYVLPDQRSLGEVFKGIDTARAQENLLPSEQLPENVESPDAAEYQSSTSNMAREDLASTGHNVTDTGAAVTMAAQDSDLSTATAFTAAQSNDPADSGSAYMAALPFLAFGRNRRRAKNGRKGDSPDQTMDPNAAPRNVADKDYHSVDAVLGKQQSATNAQPAHNASRQGDWMGKLAQKLSDTHHPFLTWVQNTGLVPRDGEFDAHPVIFALKSMANRMRQRNEALSKQYMTPIFDHVVSVAQRMGRQPDQVGLEMGSWQTFLHVPEANRALRKNLESDLNNIILTGTEEEVLAAQTKLDTFDKVQRGEANIDELRKIGVGGLAGGMTDAQARAGIKIIESRGYRPEDLSQFRRLMRTAVDGMTAERVRNGTLLQEEVDQWNAHGFKDYVPLYVNHEYKDAGNDVFLGTSNFNPAGDYTRKGSVTRASHSMITLQQMMYRTAAGIESTQFKDQLHAMYVNHRPAGLQRVNLADARMNQRSEVFNQEIHDKRGFTYTVRGLDENQQPTATRYKYYFEDDAISQGIFDHHAEPDWKVAKLLGAATAGFGRMLTKYNPLFPVKTWSRDAGERIRTVASRKITDADGNVIPAHTVYGRMMAAVYNPVHVFNLGAYLLTGARADTPTVRAYQELQRMGGVSTYQHALARSVTDMRSTLKSMTGLRKHAKSLDTFFTHWNEMWAAAPAVAGYMAMRDMNVPAEQASFRTLDVMNASNKGEWHGALSLFYPFIAPTFEGGRNLMRSLKSPRGRAVFAANVVSSIALYSMLYALAESMAGDDDDYGNILDNMSLDDMSMNIPLILGKDNIIKLPVAFGSSRVAWILGAGLHRWARGVDGPGKVFGATALAVLSELQPLELETHVMADNLVAGLVLTAAPSILSPALEVAMNTNHFGGMIHSKAAREGYAADAGMSKTPQVWTDIAQGLREYSGGLIDTYPENIRHLAQAWLVGPLRGVGTALEKSSLYTTGGQLTSRQELGPVWDAVGVAQFWDNGSRGVSRTYWKLQDQADDVLRKYGQTRSKQGTKPGQAATAAYQRVRQAGASPQEALLVQYAIEADKARTKANHEMKAKVQDFKQRDFNLERLTPQYEQHARREERMMREFIRRARRLE